MPDGGFTRASTSRGLCDLHDKGYSVGAQDEHLCVGVCLRVPVRVCAYVCCCYVGMKERDGLRRVEYGSLE